RPLSASALAIVPWALRQPLRSIAASRISSQLSPPCDNWSTSNAIVRVPAGLDQSFGPAAAQDLVDRLVRGQFGAVDPEPYPPGAVSDLVVHPRPRLPESGAAAKLAPLHGIQLGSEHHEDERLGLEVFEQVVDAEAGHDVVQNGGESRRQERRAERAGVSQPELAPSLLRHLTLLRPLAAGDDHVLQGVA